MRVNFSARPSLSLKKKRKLKMNKKELRKYLEVKIRGEMALWSRKRSVEILLKQVAEQFLSGTVVPAFITFILF